MTQPRGWLARKLTQNERDDHDRYQHQEWLEKMAYCLENLLLIQVCKHGTSHANREFSSCRSTAPTVPTAVNILGVYHKNPEKREVQHAHARVLRRLSAVRKKPKKCHKRGGKFHLLLRKQKTFGSKWDLNTKLTDNHVRVAPEEFALCFALTENIENN